MLNLLNFKILYSFFFRASRYETRFLGLALPSRCPISKKIIKIGLFFAYLEPIDLMGFLSLNAKKRAKSLIFLDFSPSSRYSIYQQRSPSDD